MTPPSRSEYGLSNMLYRDDASYRSAHRTSSPAFLDRVTFNERIEKCTNFNGDEEDGLSDSDTLSCASSDKEEKDPNLSHQVLTLRKEIESVKKSLIGMQRDHKAMLLEKQQLQTEFHQARSEANATLESSKELLQHNEMINTRMERLALTLEGVSNTSDDELPEEYQAIMNNVSVQAKQLSMLQDQLIKNKKDFRELLYMKEGIERTLAEKETEYEERIRQYEAIAAGKAGMIDQMEVLLRELKVKMDRLIGEKENRHRHNPTGSTVSAKSISDSIKNRRKQSLADNGGSASTEQQSESSNRKSDEFDAADLVPAYCLSPPQVCIYVLLNHLAKK
jgi:chromosome segregation ATPase